MEPVIRAYVQRQLGHNRVLVRWLGETALVLEPLTSLVLATFETNNGKLADFVFYARPTARKGASPLFPSVGPLVSKKGD